MPLLVDPPLFAVSGELYARALPESAQGRAAAAAAALALTAVWGAAAALWFDHPAVVPARRALGYRSGRELVLRSPLPDRRRGRRLRLRGDSARTREDALALACMAAYPLWLWLGWDRGRRARPRGGA